MKLLHVVGARPNFPKLAPVYRAAHARELMQTVVHTGQHYDDGLSGSFFRDLGIPHPTLNLEVGSGSHSQQTARIMERFEPVLEADRPDWVVVYGDVNSTLAASLVAAKLLVPVAHVEAGLRSSDWTMPEEVNRVVADRLASLLLTPSRGATETLLAEGEPESEIVFVGNVMIDSLFRARDQITDEKKVSDFAGKPGVLVTLHRPSNVDDPDRLRLIAPALSEIAKELPVIFPMHPRTQARVKALGLSFSGVRVVDPIPYHAMVSLMLDAKVVVTDSGGVQEETTALGIPCLTLRPNTERPITVTEGTNQLVADPRSLPDLVRRTERPQSFNAPEGWDGKAGERVVDALVERAKVKRP